jgi:hypothetical protein
MIRIYGASDDLVEIEGDVQDEVSPGKMIKIGTDEKGMYVTFRYAANKKSGGVWRGTVEQIEEGIPMFPMTVGLAEASGFPDPRSYSVLFTIDCPPGTPVWVGKRNLAAR